MKPKPSILLISMTLLTGLTLSVRTLAQEQRRDHDQQHRYRFIELGTFGGPVSYLANDPSGGGAADGILNRHGRVVSAADTSILDPNYPNTCLVCPFPVDPFIFHAFKWRDGVLTDLGALPGINSSFANWISNNGLVAGFSENGAIDPLLGVPEVNAVLWKEGQIINLGTLERGFESNAFAVNSRGQVAGVFVNTVPDSFSPFGLQVRAFIWETGTMADIGTLGGPDASAIFLNEHRQVVGFSYVNSKPNPPIGFGPCASANGLPTQDPFLWEEGKMTDLGTLGGTCGVPNAIDNRGEVVGLSNVAGDQSFHPFLWTRAGGMKDLGTFGGSSGQANWINESGEVVGWATNQDDRALFAFLWRQGVLTKLRPVKGEACSAALGINSRSHVVGLSAKTCILDAADRHATLWENGRVIDLNTFLPAGADLKQLTDAFNINDRGEIAGFGTPAGCDDEFACGRAFVLVPCDDDHSDQEGCQGEPNAAFQSSSVGVSRNSVNIPGVGLAAKEIANRMRLQFGRNLGFRAWPVDKGSRRQSKW
jgi:probable HAF family extracellular repeat protein